MASINVKIQHLLDFSRCFKPFMRWAIKSFPNKNAFGAITDTSLIGYPCSIANPNQVYLEEQIELRYGLTIINAKYEKVIVKKYSVIAPQCTIITNSHCSTVGVPQFILGESHVNDKSGDVIINEDVWVGANSTILAGITIGRGAIIGACALVTKDIPPYALAVGAPAKIVGVKFSKENIFNHEKELYKVNQRMKEEDIDKLFSTYYSDKKIFGRQEALTNEEREAVDRVKKMRNLNQTVSNNNDTDK